MSRRISQLVVTAVAFTLLALGLTNAHALTFPPDPMTGADSASVPSKPNSKHTKSARVGLTKKQVGRTRTVTNVPTASQSPLRTWEWRRLDLTPLDELTAGFAEFAAMGGTTVSLDISYAVDITEIQSPSERATATMDYQRRLRDYVAAASGAGLNVEACAGSPHWNRPTVRYVFDIVQDFVTKFNREPGDNLVALHYDLEPWGTKEWATESTSLSRQLLATVAKLSKLQLATTASERVPLLIDLPFWLDGTTAPKSVHFGGDHMSPTEHVMKTLDNNSGQRNAVVIMAYRDQAGGVDGSLAVSATEFKMAEKYGHRVSVVVGQEIGDVQPARITFFSGGIPAMMTSMNQLAAAYQQHQSWGGFAVDDFGALSKKLLSASN